MIIRIFLLFLVCSFLLLGCADMPQQVVQEKPEKPAPEPPVLNMAIMKVPQEPSPQYEQAKTFFLSNLNVRGLSTLARPLRRVFLGARLATLPVDKKIEDYGGKEGDVGVLLETVVDGGPAAQAGLKSGDVVTAVGGKRLEGPPGEADAELIRAISSFEIGQKVEFTILREKEELKIEVTLGERKVTPMAATSHLEIDFDKLEEESLFEKTLRDLNQFDNLLKVARMLSECSNFALHEIPSAREAKEGTQNLVNPFRLKEVTYILREPLKLSLVSQQVADSLKENFNVDNQCVCGVIRNSAHWLDVECDDFSLSCESGFNLENLMEKLETSSKRCKEAFRGLDERDLAILQSVSEIFFGDKETKDEELGQFLRVANMVDYKAIFDAGVLLAAVLVPENLKSLYLYLQTLEPISEKVEGVTGEILFYKRTEFGDVIVGGKGPNKYECGAALIVDIGGDDIYLEKGISARPGGVSLILDFGGNDIYRSEAKFVQGGSLFGIGFLFDMAGDDSYLGRDCCQGFGCFGVGVLFDAGGDDSYRAQSLCQGAALFGIGLLLDSQFKAERQQKDKAVEGNDIYRADWYAQGFGWVKGFGALMDNSGNDSYYAGGKKPDFRDPERSCVSLSQGFGYGIRPQKTTGSDGGIGLLCDLRGHDVYVGDYFCQGSSYWYALGILYDEAGDDKYISGRYSQGAGIHLSCGALIDCIGNDYYIAYLGVSQGCAHDWAAAILEDRAGDDVYTAGTLSQGAGNANGIAILADWSGNDHYHAVSSSQGWGTFDRGRNEGSFGLLLDAGGRDYFSLGHKPETIAPTESKWGMVIDYQK